MKPTTKGLIFVILSLTALVLGPSTFLSQLFPLDLGGTFEIGDLFDEKKAWIVSPYNGSGRYFPVYWLFSSFQYLFFKTHVLPYFIVQSVILVWAISLTCVLLGKVIGTSRYLWLLAVFLFLNTPLAENSSTLGKAEPAAYLLIFAAVYIFFKYRATGRQLGVRRYGWIGLLFALALLTKETSLALIGFAMAGLVLTVVANKVTGHRSDIDWKDYLNLLVTLLVSWAVTKIPYLVFWDPADLPTYLDYKITGDLIWANLSFYISQQPDIVLFALVGAALLTWQIFMTLRGRPVDTTTNLVFVVSIFLMGFAYYVVLLAWRWPMAYYMLLPSVIFRFAAVYGIYHLAKFRLTTPIALRSVLVLSGAALIYSSAYLFYVIGSQVSYSRLYTQAVRAYAAESDGKSRLVMENYPFYAEQVTGTHLILRFVYGESFRIGGISDLFQNSSNSSDVQRLLGIGEDRMKANMQNLPKKGDYLLVFKGRKIATWFLRGVAPFIYEDSTFKQSGNYDLELVTQNTIKLPSAYFNIWTGRPEVAQTWLGFSLYKVLNSQARYFWQDRASDRWLGKNSTLFVDETFGPNPVLRVSSPSFALPNRITILKDGKPFKEVAINDTSEILVKLDQPSRGTAEYQISVEKTVAPIDIGLNLDKRKLGVLADLEQGEK